MTDLLYAMSDELWSEIKVAFPQAQLEADYDDIGIHEDRTSVEIPGVERREWYVWLTKSGWGGISLNLQLSLRLNHELVESVLDEVHPNWRTEKRKST